MCIECNMTKNSNFIDNTRQHCSHEIFQFIMSKNTTYHSTRSLTTLAMMLQQSVKRGCFLLYQSSTKLCCFGVLCATKNLFQVSNHNQNSHKYGYRIMMDIVDS